MAWEIAKMVFDVGFTLCKEAFSRRKDKHALISCQGNLHDCQRNLRVMKYAFGFSVLVILVGVFVVPRFYSITPRLEA